MNPHDQWNSADIAQDVYAPKRRNAEVPVYDAEYFEPPRGKMQPVDKFIWYAAAMVTVMFWICVIGWLVT